MNDIGSILKLFAPTALGSLGKAGLMERKETKFIFPERMLPEILGSLRNDYEVLEINGQHIMNYETVYFDTPDFFHFRQHLTRRRTRYKVRFRKYLDTNCTFFEIKSKNNHNRTIKERIQISRNGELINAEERIFLDQHSPLGTEILEKKLHVHYSRITLVNKQRTERVTIDLDLTYSNDGLIKSFPGLVIAEVKQDVHLRSHFVSMMRQCGIREFSVSKYCLGIISLYGHIRHNLYKPKIRYINHFIYASQRNP